MKRPTIDLLACVLGGFLLACSGAPAGDQAPPGAGGQPGSVPAPAAVPGAESGGMAYPALYGELNLPELPGGLVESTGRRRTVTLRDGLVIRLKTPLPVADVRDYYSRELRGLGWEEVRSRPVPGSMMAGLLATKDGVTFRATITALGESTQVSINVHDR